ncbi:MAG TPA: hypothetical protein VGL89_03275 [Candidatus Koribacter sp.]
MNFQIRVSILVALLIALATSGYAIDVKTDYDHHADFSQYKTYSWAKVEMPDPLWNDRVKETGAAASRRVPAC